MPAGHPVRDANRLSGRVTVFDAHAGLGEVEGSDGRRYPFHCAAIVDGTRAIDEGADIEFTVTAGPLGRWEATGIDKT